MEKKIHKITEIEELEQELRRWKLKLEIQQTKSKLILEKAAMNEDPPEQKRKLMPEPF